MIDEVLGDLSMERSIVGTSSELRRENREYCWTSTELKKKRGSEDYTNDWWRAKQSFLICVGKKTTLATQRASFMMKPTTLETQKTRKKRSLARPCFFKTQYAYACTWLSQSKSHVCRLFDLCPGNQGNLLFVPKFRWWRTFFKHTYVNVCLD